MADFHYHQEVYRKLLHLSSLWTAVVIYLFDKNIALPVFAVGVLAVLVYEIVRRQDHKLSRLLERLLGAALRPEEKFGRFNPSGAIYMLVAAFLCTLFFPRMIAVTAMAMMLTGDVAAALVGRKFGRKKIYEKTLEGAAAFFVTALGTAALISTDGAYMRAATAAAFVAALVELVSKKIRINDNLTVPLAAGAVMLFLQHLF